MKITFFKDGDVFFRLPVLSENPCVGSKQGCPLNKIVGVFRCVNCVFGSRLPKGCNIFNSFAIQKVIVPNRVIVETDTTIFLVEEQDANY